MDFHSCLLALFTFFVYVHCQPYRYTTQQKQACGDKLVEMMQLVCGERGYNPSFRSQERVRRIRRGIVEECCRKSCSQDILELYCRPETPESSSNVQKRKRSDTSEEKVTGIANSNEETGVLPGVITNPNKESPNSITNLFNKEATQRTIQEKLNVLYQDNEYHNSRTFHSSREEENEKDKKLVELNHLDSILKEEANTRSPLSDPIRHWHSKKIFHKHQANKVPEKNADEDESTAFQIGIQKPYYSVRKQSRSRNHPYSH